MPFLLWSIFVSLRPLTRTLWLHRSLVSMTSSANKLLLQKACMLVLEFQLFSHFHSIETFRCRHAAGYHSSLFVYCIPVHAGALNYDLHIAIWETDCNAWFGLCQLTWFWLRSPLIAVKKYGTDRRRSSPHEQCLCDTIITHGHRPWEHEATWYLQHAESLSYEMSFMIHPICEKYSVNLSWSSMKLTNVWSKCTPQPFCDGDDTASDPSGGSLANMVSALDSNFYDSFYAHFIFTLHLTPLVGVFKMWFRHFILIFTTIFMLILLKKRCASESCKCGICLSQALSVFSPK